MMLAILNHWLHTHKKSFFTFALVGGMTAVLNLLLFSIFWRWLALNYLLAVSLAFGLAVLFHFTMNRRYTFRSHGKNLSTHMKKYLLLTALNFILTLLIVDFVVKVLLLSPFLGVVFSIGVTMISGYMLGRNWVFK